ncbi:phospholipase-like, Aminotransferase-like mobile domain protein [Artemisia annua]|uniref:Phospholipase-like, Aminotransferase-like mobile domain protein n=1 Tax=Artemisia annua TaxID=35608 RepID=A0A2U1MIT3_ARTAN|nr:phospholipase-like, Aminotransferase-like mobile domain protein [Artemisia annua]
MVKRQWRGRGPMFMRSNLHDLCESLYGRVLETYRREELRKTLGGRKFPWDSWIPKKINICLWRASLDRLPSNSNLSSRGASVSSTVCPLCNSEIELLDHCLINCLLVKSVLTKFIWKWQNEVVHPSLDDAPSILRKDLFPHLQQMARLLVSNRFNSSRCVYLAEETDLMSPRIHESDVKVHIRSKLHYFQLIKDRLSDNRRRLFRSTCFGPWLDLNYFENDESLIHYMLQNQIKSDDAHYDLPLIYDVNGHHLHFGRRQFHLITGFKFGMPSFRKFRTGDIIFRDRVFPEKIGVDLKAIDLLCLIEEDEYFIKLSDEDAVRVCLLLTAQVIFMGREMLSVVDDVYLRMVENFENWNDFHWGEHIWRQLYDAIRNTYSSKKLEYSLAGFVFAFKIWILEVSTQSLRWWSKELDLIPRALSWSKKVPFQGLEYFGQLFPEASIHFVFAYILNLPLAKEINHDLYPTRAESVKEWYTKGIRFFNWYAPRAAPAVNRGGLFEDYLCKRAALRAKFHAIDNEVPAPQASYTLQDRVRTLQGICNGFMLLPAEVNSLRSRVHKLETYIQYILRKMKAGHRHNVVEKELKELEKDKFDNEDKDAYIADEYCPNLNHNFLNLFETEIQKEFLKDEKLSEKDVEEEDCVYLATQERLAAEKKESEIRRVSAQREERLRVLNEQEKNVHITNHIFKAPHMQRAFQNFGSKKRQHTLVLRPEFKDVDDDVNLPTLDQLKGTISPLTPYMIQKCKDLKHWQEDLKRPSKRIDKVFVDRQLEDFITNNGQSRFKFPWCNDIVVDHHFWDCFLGMDDTREGWLRDEHIELWVLYLWYVRPTFADWSIVSSYFLTLLLQETLPLFYANKEVYKLSWADVDRVFIPINEPKKHWSVAQFHIQSGLVIVYDSVYRGEEECREWYLKMRNCLEVNLPLILQETGVFEKKRINPENYKISFRLAQNVPKQGGVFGDCGVFVCLFLYRLAHGIHLHVDDPTQAALAYREGLIRFYFENKINCI